VLEQLGAAFGIGLLATLSPCALPLYPGFLAYLAAGAAGERGSARWLGLYVLGGVLTMMVALGALIAALSVAVGRVLVIVTPLADLAVIALGVALLVGLDPFSRLPVVAGAATGGSRARSAYVYGLMYGPIALPCSGALLVSIFTLSVGIASFAEKMLFFLVFGLGFGVPLLLISLVAEGRQRALLRLFTRHHRLVSRLAGIVLVAVGLWDFAANLPVALLYLS
jgi:cytochrome c-type biogenesis protein